MNKELCKVIAESQPCSLDAVERVFDITKSIDKTIFILDLAQKTAIAPFELATDYMQLISQP